MQHQLQTKELWTSVQVQQIAEELPRKGSKIFIESLNGYYTIEKDKKADESYLVKFFKKIAK